VIPLEPVPDGIDPVVGWRYWGCDTLSEPDGPGGAAGENACWLTSISRFSTWPARTPTRARCSWSALHEADGSGIPHASCSCGVYAVSDLDVLKEVADPTDGTPGGGRAVVVGTVAIWGRIIPGEWGWRGEQAYPRELWVVRETVPADVDPRGLAARLQAAYQVPAGVCEAARALPQDARLPTGADTAALAAAAWDLSHSLDRLAAAASAGRSAYEEELRRFFSRAGIGGGRLRQGDPGDAGDPGDPGEPGDAGDPAGPGEPVR
jgi:hypothetical protein